MSLLKHLYRPAKLENALRETLKYKSNVAIRLVKPMVASRIMGEGMVDYPDQEPGLDRYEVEKLLNTVDRLPPVGSNADEVEPYADYENATIDVVDSDLRDGAGPGANEPDESDEEYEDDEEYDES